MRLGELAAYDRRDAGPPSLAAAAPGVDDPSPAGTAASPTTPAPPSTTDRKDTP